METYLAGFISSIAVVGTFLVPALVFCAYDHFFGK